MVADKGLRIVAITQRGRKAMIQHELERLKMPWAQKKIFEGLYHERLIDNSEGFVIELLHKRSDIAAVIPFNSLAVPIKDALKKNGAKVNIDYKIVKVGE